MADVAVTGAAGHLGLTVCQLLLSRGHTVRAVVRDADSPAAHLLRQQNAKVVQGDARDPEILRAAFSGADSVCHLAAVYRFVSKNPEDDVHQATLSATRAMLDIAREVGISQVVMTSSALAVGMVRGSDQCLTESDWYDGAADPYIRAKVDSERLAWSYVRSTRMRLVTLLPSGIIGPNFFRHTPSTQFIAQLANGHVPVLLPFAFAFVDVRDVASAHVRSIESATTSGRYILSARFCPLDELCGMVAHARPGARLPRLKLPSWALASAPWFDGVWSRMRRQPRLLTREFIREFADRKQLLSTERARRELAWDPLPLEKSLMDTLNWLDATAITSAPS